ncbi:MAG TPA: DUF4231 domain-containing protein, partial [Flavisolibacter sp.]|nr:DUF4231 domain-containing protein [Flavisolibacter sp.]
MSDVQKQMISFENGQQATGVLVTASSPLQEIAEALAIPAPKAVILSIGGAEDVSPDLLPRLTQLYSRGIARAAIETGALIIDGGTRAGVMSLMGEGVAARGYRTTLLGVAPAAKITWPGSGAEKGTLLEPNHSHFVLTEGTEWGAETPMLFALTQWFTGHANAGTTNPAPGESAKIPALAVLASGGAVTRQEALLAVRRAIPLIIIEGSGGVADEIAAAWKQKDDDINDPTLAEIISDGELHFHNLANSIKGIERLIIRELGNDKVLQQALQTYATYDLNANLQQAYFNKLQLSIIVIGVLSTALVVIQQVFAPPSPESGPAAMPPVWAAVHYLLILLPILLTVLISAANRFKQGNKWLLLRAGAESIKREIYSYRVHSRSNQGEAEQQLAKKLEDITRRTMQTEVNLAALKPYNEGKGYPPNASGATGGDDGYSPLSPDRYVEVRLDDQL